MAWRGEWEVSCFPGDWYNSFGHPELGQGGQGSMNTFLRRVAESHGGSGLGATLVRHEVELAEVVYLRQHLRV